MSFSKLWKLALASFFALSLAACAGSRQGGDAGSDGEEYSEESEGGAAAAAKPKAVDENELKKTEQDAVKATEENHELRRQIFEAKTQLGISTQDDQQEEAPADGAAADAQ